MCLGLLFLSGLLAFFTRLAPAVAIPDLQQAFALDAVELGVLTALYLWPFALMQPMAGVLVDGFGARRTVTIFLVIAGAGQVLFALAPSFPVALFGRALTGLGASTLYVGAAKIMTRWFRSSEFGTLTGAWTSVANLGGLTAAGPLAAAIALVGWRMSLGMGGLAVLVTALLVHIFVRDPPGELKLPLFGTMTMMQGLWAVPYLMDSYGQTRQQAANMLTLWSVGLIVGCTLWGFVAENIVTSHISAVILAQFPLAQGHIPVAAYQALFWFSLASVGLSIVLVAFSEERWPASTIGSRPAWPRSR